MMMTMMMKFEHNGLFVDTYDNGRLGAWLHPEGVDSVNNLPCGDLSILLAMRNGDEATVFLSPEQATELVARLSALLPQKEQEWSFLEDWPHNDDLADCQDCGNMFDTFVNVLDGNYLCPQCAAARDDDGPSERYGIGPDGAYRIG